MITANEVKRAKEKAVGGKKDRCRKGKSCSAACISGWKACLVEMSGGVSTSLNKMRRSVVNTAKKVTPGLRGRYLEERKEKYVGARKKLVSQIERATLKKDKARKEALLNKLERLEGGMGAKLKVPKAEPISSEKNIRIADRRRKYMVAKDSILDKMDKAAKTGKRGTYDKWEKTLMTLQGKAGKKFGDKDIVKKGEQWESWKKVRLDIRKQKFPKLQNKLTSDMNNAAIAGDRKKYLSLQRALAKVEERTGVKLGLSDTKKAGLKNEEIWRNARLGLAGDKLLDKMMKAIADDNRGQYDKLREKYDMVKSKMPSIPRNLPGGDIWESHQGLAHFVSRLEETDLKNGRPGVKNIGIEYYARQGSQELRVVSDVLGNKISLNISPEDFSFTVNGSYTASDNLSRREEITITREVRRQFGEITKSIGDGTVLSVSAAHGDGREEKRERAYVGFGFSDPDSSGYMYGRVKRGAIVRSDEFEFYDQRSDSFSKAA